MTPRGARRASASSITPSLSRPLSRASTTRSDDDCLYANDTQYADSIRRSIDTVENPFQDPPAPSNDQPENPFEPPEPAHTQDTLHARRSIRKSLGLRRGASSPDRSRHDPRSSHIYQHTHRANSTSSLISYAPSQAASISDNGPSHAYESFDQGFGGSVRGPGSTASILGRSSSLRSTRSRQGPTHPYNLYPQDVSGLLAPAQNVIPVGFPGHAQHYQYHRRIGPEGEEQDLIGQDGHTEQLPPYTRWPDDSTTKTVAVGPMPPIGERSSDALGVEETERVPQSPPDVAENPDQIEIVSSEVTLVGDDRSTTIVMSEKAPSERSWKEKSWKERGKTRVCGIFPLWTIALWLFVIVFIAIVCGGVISAFMHDTRKHIKQADADAANLGSTSATPTATYYDAAPTNTPSNMTPLPTGTFIVPLGDPDILYGACLDTNQFNAWTCTLPLQQSLCVTIEQSVGTDRAYLSTCNNQTGPTYGTQPPLLIQQTLKLVTDLDNQTLGPAWHFQTFYDKLAILPASFLSPDSYKAKRDVDSSWSWPFSGQPAQPVLDKRQTYEGEVQPGEAAWFCHWDDTFIEGFIYATVNNPLPTPVNTTSSSSTYSASSWPTPTFYARYAQPSSYQSDTSQQSDSSHHSDAWAGHHPPPNNGFAGFQRYDPTPPQEYDYGNWGGNAIRARDDDDAAHTSVPSTSPGAATPLPTGTTLTPTLSSAGATNATSTWSHSWHHSHSPSPCAIPRLVKFEERRLKGLHDQATCNLMIRMPDYTFKSVNGTSGPVVLQLVEDDGPNGVNQKLKMLKRTPFFGGGATGGGAALERRQSRYVPSEVDETCFCQWTSEQFELPGG